MNETALSGRGFAQWVLAVVAVAGLVVVAVISWPDVVAATRGLDSARPSLLVAAVAAQGLTVAAAAGTYRAAVRVSGGWLDSRSAVEASLGAGALSRVLPAGGAVGAWYATRRLQAAGIDRVAAMTAPILVGMVTLATLPLVVAAGGAIAAARGSVGWAPAVASGLVAALVVAGLGLAAVIARRDPAPDTLLPPPAGGVVGRWARRAGLDGHVVPGLLAAMGDPRSLCAVGAAAVRYWLLDAAVLWLLFAAFGMVLHPGLVVLGTGAANLATALPITPGGLGLAEAGMGAAFVALSVPAALAVTVVLTYRLLSLWLPGLVALTICRRNFSAVTA